MQCSACQHSNKPAARFCEACGVRLAPTCPSCGEGAGAQARFCAHVYATFTEGFDTRDLIDAKTLLEELS